MSWYLKVLKHYVDFEGRARRKEYWMFVLFNMIFAIIAMIIDKNGVVYGIYALAVLLPSIAVSIRRMHDIGKSGWILLVGLIPIVGFIWLIILMVKDSDQGQNQYGPNPKEFT